MQELLDATDWKQALQDGRVTPKAGIDSAFDEAVESKSQAEAALTVRALLFHLNDLCDVMYSVPAWFTSTKQVGSAHKKPCTVSWSCDCQGMQTCAV